MIDKDSERINKVKELLKSQNKVKKMEIPVDFTPYSSRGIVNPGESWQQKAERLFKVNKNLKMLVVLAANSTGKTAMNAYLVASLLRGEHPLYDRFKPSKENPLKVRFMTYDYNLQVEEFQSNLNKITRQRISQEPGLKHPSIKIRADKQVYQGIYNLETFVEVRCLTATKGAKAVVGGRPDIQIIDEPPSEEVWQECVARALKEDALIILTATPAAIADGWVVPYIEGLIEDNLNKTDEESEIVVMTAATWDNPYVATELIERRVAEAGGPESAAARLRYWGDFKAGFLNTLSGIRKRIVPDSWWPTKYCLAQDLEHIKYFHDSNPPWLWIEVQDYGSSVKDPTFCTWYRVFIEDGTIIQEDEFYDPSGKFESWVNGIHQTRNRLGLRPIKDEFYRNITVRGTKYYYSEPDYTIGDRQYLCRSSSIHRVSTIQTEFEKFGINPVPSSGDKVDMGIPLVKALISHPELFYIRERCKKSLYFADRDMPKVGPTGKLIYDNRYNHYTDNLRYLCEALRDLGLPTFERLSMLAVQESIEEDKKYS